MSSITSPSAGIEAPHGSRRIGSGVTVVLVLLIAGFAALRFAALRNDLWMDEVWSIKAVSELKSVGEIFTRYLQANNHPLSSLWLYAIAPARIEWMYRAFSWLSGVGSLVLGVLISLRQFRDSNPTAGAAQLRVVALSAAVLLGSCYFLIVYSSEARGYAPALMFGLLAYYLLLCTPVDCPPITRLVAYWTFCILALLSHAASAQVIGAAILWSAVRNFGAGMSWLRSARTLIAWHALPVVAIILFYFLFLRRVSVGGAPEPAIQQTLGELVAYTFGLPSPRSGFFAMPLLIAAAGYALWRMGRRAPADAAFYGALIFSAPVFSLLAARLAVLFPRYFIFGSAWSLLLLAYGAGAVWTRHRLLPLAGTLAAAAFVFGNSIHTRTLLEHGRGEYRAALRYIAEHTSTSDISLCSDHDNRNYMLIEYYGVRELPKRRLYYFPGNGAVTGKPQWLFVHRLDAMPIPANPLYDERGNTYQLERTFLHAPLAGWDWYVYRNTTTRQ